MNYYSSPNMTEDERKAQVVGLFEDNHIPIWILKYFDTIYIVTPNMNPRERFMFSLEATLKYIISRNKCNSLTKRRYFLRMQERHILWSLYHYKKFINRGVENELVHREIIPNSYLMIRDLKVRFLGGR